MANTVVRSDEQGLVTLRLDRKHGNAINSDLVADLSTALGQIKQDDNVRGVLLAGAGKLFSPGLDLQELIDLDRKTMEGFLERFDRLILGLYTFPKPMVAAVHGHAVAGGCVLALTADWRVLAEGALIGLNEVRVGVPFPFGVAMLLRETIPAARIGEVALFGRNYRDDEAVAAGLVHEVHPAHGFESYAMQRLEELVDKEARAFAITKRYLRQPTAERMQSAGPEQAGDFLDTWFSPATRDRLQAVVGELKARG